jgi:outer membrane protein TolC
MRTRLLNIALLLLMFLFALAWVTHAAAPPAATSPPGEAKPLHEVDPAVASFIKPVEAAQGDDELRQKMKQRHNTAVRLLELRIESYRKGLADVSGVFEAAREVADADRDLAQSAEEREAAAKHYVEVLSAGEKRLEEQFKSGVGTETNLLRARLARESAEVDLLKLQKNK